MKSSWTRASPAGLTSRSGIRARVIYQSAPADRRLRHDPSGARDSVDKPAEARLRAGRAPEARGKCRGTARASVPSAVFEQPSSRVGLAERKAYIGTSSSMPNMATPVALKEAMRGAAAVVLQSSLTQGLPSSSQVPQASIPPAILEGTQIEHQQTGNPVPSSRGAPSLALLQGVTPDCRRRGIVAMADGAC